MEMIKRAVMEKVRLDFFKEVCGSEKEPETEESGGEQKKSHDHGCQFYLSDHISGTIPDMPKGVPFFVKVGACKLM